MLGVPGGTRSVGSASGSVATATDPTERVPPGTPNNKFIAAESTGDYFSLSPTLVICVPSVFYP